MNPAFRTETNQNFPVRTIDCQVDFQVGEGSQTGNGLRDSWETKLDEFVGQL